MIAGNKPTAIDLFSGCGGLTLGLKRAGFRVLGAVDVDPVSVKTYRANHRSIKVWETDIRYLEPEDIESSLELDKGELDLLTGCPPCQGFSTLRTMNGAHRVEDPRNGLLLEMIRFIKVLKPKAVMVENVPGLAADQKFQEFYDLMENLGYRGDYRILNAADYGVPQRPA